MQAARKLLDEASPAIKGPHGVVAEAVSAAISANFAAEASIQLEAERTFEKLGSSTSGMDRDTLLRGLKERISQARGFALGAAAGGEFGGPRLAFDAAGG